VALGLILGIFFEKKKNSRFPLYYLGLRVIFHNTFYTSCHSLTAKKLLAFEGVWQPFFALFSFREHPGNLAEGI